MCTNNTALKRWEVGEKIVCNKNYSCALYGMDFMYSKYRFVLEE